MIYKVENGTEQGVSYTYDKLGQLLREDNAAMNKTYVYTYDRAGNITSKKTYAYTTDETITSSPTSTRTYAYGNGRFGDLLTAYQGTALVYDANYNPTTYYNGTSYAMTWQYARQLASVVKGGAGRAIAIRRRESARAKRWTVSSTATFCRARKFWRNITARRPIFIFMTVTVRSSALPRGRRAIPPTRMSLITTRKTFRELA